MNFYLKEWYEYRSKSRLIGKHIQSYKDKTGTINLDKETLQGYIAHITCILKECTDYMDKCGLTVTPSLWKYNVKDPTTHPSSKLFLYKDRMSKKAIRAYGNGFMTSEAENANSTLKP